MLTHVYNHTRGYMMMATDDSYKVTVTLSHLPPFAYAYVTNRSTGQSFEEELTKAQVTHFLSLHTAAQFTSFAHCLPQAQA